MKKTRKRTTFREDVGKLLLDTGKLVFGSVFLGSSCVAEYHTLYWQ